MVHSFFNMGVDGGSLLGFYVFLHFSFDLVLQWLHEVMHHFVLIKRGRLRLASVVVSMVSMVGLSVVFPVIGWIWHFVLDVVRAEMGPMRSPLCTFIVVLIRITVQLS